MSAEEEVLVNASASDPGLEAAALATVRERSLRAIQQLRRRRDALAAERKARLDRLQCVACRRRQGWA